MKNENINAAELSYATLPVVNIDLTSYKQEFEVPKEIRYKYGEINTPFFFIEKMFSLLKNDEFNNPNKKWLDIGSGKGYFSIYLFQKLFTGLETVIPNVDERVEHIVCNMMYMTEIQEDNCNELKRLFGENCNIFSGDFITNNEINCHAFDFVIGNPPFNNNGVKKVPTNCGANKKEDGTTIWISFIKKAIDLLSDLTGKMLVIIPSIWMKSDKAKMHEFMLQYKIEKIHCMNNTETNKIFNKYAQTPTCYFLLTKDCLHNECVTVYDQDKQSYETWRVREIEENKCLENDTNTNVYPNIIPVFGINIIKKIMKKFECIKNGHGCLSVIKTNLPNKDSKFSNIQDKTYIHPNVSTCQLGADGLTPELVINYSNISQPHSGKPKLIMAHKMYGFPYIDVTGMYGLSNRDNYVILNRTLNELMILKAFFSTKTALYLFETTRYRMKYLEKYVFDLIPDVTQLDDFTKNHKEIDDIYLWNYFGFDADDIKHVQKLHKKDYKFFN
jgi:tRNA1(Val) A37 N6-methylase TrmN6